MRIYTEQSAFSLVDLVKRREGSSWIVGNENSEIYVSISEKGYEILRLFERGRNVSEIRKISREHFGNVNIDAFIRNLLRHEFVRAIDGIPIQNPNAKRISPMFSWIKPAHVSWLFSEAAYAIYAVLIFFAIAIMIFFHGYFPRQSDYFFVSEISIVVIASFFVGWLLVFVHEFAHHAACLSYNVPASFGITNRLYYLVAVTDVTNVYSLDRKKRYRVYFAGIGVDLVIAALCIIALFLSDMHMIMMPQFAYSFLKFIALLEMLGIAWQFYFYLRTDIYYVIENFFRINNLHKKTQLFIRAIIRSFEKKKLHHFQPIHASKSEKKVIMIYAACFVIGIAASFAMLAFYGIPIAVRLITRAFLGLFRGALAGNQGVFYDSALFMLFWLVNQGLLLYALIKSYKLYQKPLFYWGSIAALIATNHLLVLLFVIIILSNLRSPQMLYLSMAGLGFAFGSGLIMLAKKLNALSNQIIMPLMAPALALVVSAIIFAFSSYLIKSLRIPITLSSEIIPMFSFMYTVGIALSYLATMGISALKSHEM